MITTLTGTITHKGLDWIVLEVAGVGYQIKLPTSEISGLSGQITLYTHEVIRDDAHDLFGFFSIEALELFWKLVSVSGVGPKVGQKIVTANAVEEVKSKIMAGDLSFLTNISGVGKKTAQKIILELKGALAEETPTATLDQDALAALVNLGITRREAEEMLAEVEAEDTDERIRQALKLFDR